MYFFIIFLFHIFLVWYEIKEHPDGPSA